MTMATNIYEQLNDKFQANIRASVLDNITLQDEVDVRARAISAFSDLCAKSASGSHQTELSEIFNEVFSDIIVSIYQACCALDKPAQVTLRTGFELGVGIVYLWDYPTQYWAWKVHDRDLNFNEMIEYLSSDAYTTFVSEMKGDKTQVRIDVSECKDIYRQLSNTIHGKPASHESKLQDRFNYTSADWNAHLELVKRVQIELLNLYSCRFSLEYLELKNQLPILKTI